MTSETTHSPLSPSKAEIWLNCPGALAEIARVERELGARPNGEEAEWGTKAHALAEHDLAGFCLGSRTTTKIDAEEDMIEVVNPYLNSVLADIQFGGTDTILGVEKKLMWDVDNRVGGTPDCVHQVGMELVVTDLKTGAGVYVAPDAPQLRIYGMLAAKHYLKFHPLQHWSVTLRVVQPRYVRDGVDPIREVTYRADELVEQVESELRAALAEIDAHPDRTVPGSDCHWCPAVAGCKETLKLLVDAQAIEPTSSPMPTPAAIADLKYLLDREEIATQIFKQARAAAERLLAAGYTIEGYTLKESLGHRMWNKDDEEIAEALKTKGLDESKIWNRKIISPAQAEKLGLKKKLNGLTERRSLGHKLARAKAGEGTNVLSELLLAAGDE